MSTTATPRSRSAVVHHDRVAGGAGGVDELELGPMGEHRLGDKRAAPLDELLAGLRRDERSLVGVGRRVVGPAVFGDLIGVDEHAAPKQRRQRELDEGGLTGAVGSGNEVEPFHGVAGALIPFRPASTLGHQDRTAVGSVLDDVAVVVEGDCGEAGRSVTGFGHGSSIL